MISTIDTCSKLIKQSKNIVVLTGAGISTESGIPDFRSKKGVYQMVPETILSREFFFQSPEVFYEFAVNNLYHPDAKPNKGHRILAKWEHSGRVQMVITQNIDGLHQSAGSKEVVEFHGAIQTLTCQNHRCSRMFTLQEIIKGKEGGGSYYFCPACRNGVESLLKPDVVLFGDHGEWMSSQNFMLLIKKIWEADLVLVLGTSLTVYPFADLVTYRNERTPVVVINHDSTSLDNEEHVYVIHDSIGKTLEAIDRLL